MSNPPRVEDLDPEVERRLFAVVAGITGRMPVNHLAEQLGISRQRYYQLQEKALGALREALQSNAPGPQGKQESAEVKALRRQVEELERKLKRTESLLEVARRQANGPQKDPDPDPPPFRKPSRQGDPANRYPASQKHQALWDLDQERSLGISLEDFCQATGYSDRTLRRWKHRAREGKLLDLPSRPLQVANRIPDARRIQILEFHRSKGGTYGAETLKAKMEAPESVSSIRRIVREPWEPQQVVWTYVGVCQSVDFMHLGPLGRWGRMIVGQEAYSRFKPLWESRAHWSSRLVAGYLLRLWDLLGMPLFLKHDLGSEFISDYFQDFLKEHRVIPLPSPPRRPQFNGQQERGNRFIREWTRPVEQSGRQELLPGVIHRAWEDLNFQRPLKVLEWRTPHEAFTFGPRLPQGALTRDRLLQRVGGLITMLQAEGRRSSDRWYFQRKAAGIAAQEWGLLCFRPRRKCQPIPA